MTALSKKTSSRSCTGSSNSLKSNDFYWCLRENISILTWYPSIIPCVNFDIRQFFINFVGRIEHRHCTDSVLRNKISEFNETCDVENSLIRTTGGTWNKCMRHDFAESNALYCFFLSLVMFNLVTYIKHSHLLTKIALCPHIWKFDSWLASISWSNSQNQKTSGLYY